MVTITKCIGCGSSLDPTGESKWDYCPHCGRRLKKQRIRIPTAKEHNEEA